MILKNKSWRLLQSQEDYDLIAMWWEEENKNVYYPFKILPKNTIIITDKDTGVDIYAGCLFFTDTPLAWLGMVVGNSKASVESRKGGKEYLYFIVETIAKLRGAEIMFSTTDVKPLINSQLKNGYIKGDENCVNLYKKI